MPDDYSFEDDAFGEDASTEPIRSEQPSDSLPLRVLRVVGDAIRGGLRHLYQGVKENWQSPEVFSRGLKYIVGGTLGLSFLIVLMLLLFYRPGQGAKPSPSSGAIAMSGETSANLAADPGSPGGTILSWVTTPIDPDQYLVPAVGSIPQSLKWVLSRSPHLKWSSQDVSRFWVDPKELVVEHLAKENRNLVDSVLGKAP